MNVLPHLWRRVAACVRQAGEQVLGEHMCLGCSQAASGSLGALCSPCAAVCGADIRARCAACDWPVSSLASSKALCGHCGGLGLGAFDERAQPPLSAVRWPLCLQGPSWFLSQALRRCGDERALETMASLLGADGRARALLCGAAAIAFVPSPPDHVMRAGVHPAGLLARTLVRALGRPAVPTWGRLAPCRVALVADVLGSADDERRLLSAARALHQRGAIAIDALAVGLRPW